MAVAKDAGVKAPRWVAVIRKDRWTIPIGFKGSPDAPITVYGDRALAKRIVRLLNGKQK